MNILANLFLEGLLLLCLILTTSPVEVCRTVPAVMERLRIPP